MAKYLEEIKDMRKRTFWIMLIALFLAHHAFHSLYVYEKPNNKIYVYQKPELEELSFDYFKREFIASNKHLVKWTLNFVTNSSDIPSHKYYAYFIFMGFWLLFIALCCDEVYALKMYGWEKFFEKYGVDLDKERKNVS